MDDSALEAQVDLAALRLDQDRLDLSHAESVSSINSSQLTAFLIEQGILPPKGPNQANNSETEQNDQPAATSISVQIEQISTPTDPPPPGPGSSPRFTPGVDSSAANRSFQPYTDQSEAERALATPTSPISSVAGPSDRRSPTHLLDTPSSIFSSLAPCSPGPEVHHIAASQPPSRTRPTHLASTDYTNIYPLPIHSPELYLPSPPASVKLSNPPKPTRFSPQNPYYQQHPSSPPPPQQQEEQEQQQGHHQRFYQDPDEREILPVFSHRPVTSSPISLSALRGEVPSLSALRGEGPEAQTSMMSRDHQSQNRDSVWQRLSRLLRQEGYQVAAGKEEEEGWVDVIEQVLRDYRKRGEILQAYTANQHRTATEQRDVQERLSDHERARSVLDTSLQGTESRVKELQIELEESRKSCQERVKESKVRLSNVTAQLRQSEQRVRVKETQMEKILQKFEGLVQKEAREKERERIAIKKVMQRDPRGADNKYVDMIGALDSARRRAQEEIIDLKEEVHLLNDALKEKENYITRRESGAPGGVGLRRHQRWEEGQGRGLQELVEEVQRLERCVREASKRENLAEKKAEALGEEVRQLRPEVNRLEEDKTNLILELKARPTVRMWKASEQRINELEGQLQKAVDDARDAYDIRQLRSFMGVGELVQRDKLNFRFRLDRVDCLSREVMKEFLRCFRAGNCIPILAGLLWPPPKPPSKPALDAHTFSPSRSLARMQEVLKETCRQLELSDITEISPALHNMIRALHGIPRLERFAKMVCGYVSEKVHGEYYEDGRPVGKGEAWRRITLEEAAQALQCWHSELSASSRLRSLRSRLVTRLYNRRLSPEAGFLGREDRGEDGGEGAERQVSPSVLSDEEILAGVSELMDFERKVMESRRVQNQAEELLEARPDLLIHRVVQHFRHLFQVRSIDGLFPTINDLYLYVNEQRNLNRVLKGQLGLSPTATSQTVQNALEKLIRESQWQEAQGTGQEGRITKRSTKGSEGRSDGNEGENDIEESEHGTPAIWQLTESESASGLESALEGEQGQD